MSPCRYHVHRSVQSLGYVMGLAGFVLGWVVGGTDSPYRLHRNMGISVIVLGTIQASAGCG